MYNPDMKNDFITQYTGNDSKLALFTACISLFNTIEKYELEYGLDVCAFSEEQLISIADKLATLRSDGSRLRVRILQEYSKWCMRNNVSGANDNILHLSSSLDNKGKIKHSMVGGPLQLHGYLNKLFSPVSDMETDVIYRCVYWLAYAGIDITDALKVKANDIHLSDMVISYGGKIYPIYREGRDVFKACAEATQFVYRNPTYSHIDFMLRDRIPGDELIRGIRNALTESSLRTRLSKYTAYAIRAGKTDTKLSYYGAYLSGLFYRMYEQEIDGWNVDFTDVADAEMAKKLDDNSKVRIDASFRGARSKKAKQYLLDYNKWKEIFIK